MNEVRFVDLFSGIGGFRLGLKKASKSHDTCSKQLPAQGWKWNKDKEEILDGHSSSTSRKTWGQSAKFRCVWSCDNNKYANQVYAKQFGEANHHPGDIKGVDPRNIPGFDFLCAGFPCQAFSVAGKRKGFQDTRGTLFFEICRIAEAKRPSLLLLENVKGLLSHDGGRTFTVVLQSLDELGYWVEWQVLNSKHFGVPQNRERVFVVGHLRGTGGREVFPLGETDSSAYEAAEVEDSEFVSTVTAGYGKQNMRGSYLRSTPTSTSIDANYSKGADKHRQRTMVLRWQNKQQGVVVDDKAPALRASGGTDIRKKPKVAISFTNPHNPDEERKVNLGDVSRAVKPPYGNQQPLVFHENISRNVSILEEAVALRSGASHSYQGVIENFRIRRLTPVECERLQGFSDGWTEGLSDTQRYKCLGIAVTVNVVEFLGCEILKSLEASDV